MIRSRVLKAAAVEGPVLILDEPLSFWGAFEPRSGVILDVHHPQRGACLAGTIVLMRETKGSGSAPGGIAEAIRLGETYASEIRRLDARVGDLKRSEETLRKELAAARSAEQAARQSIAELAPLRTSLAKQNESIRRQNETVTKQNAAIRSQNESLRKLVEERDAVVRLLNERTELLNKLNAAGSSK